MNGFLASVSIYREASYLGVPTGGLYLVPGITGSVLSMRPGSRFEKRGAFAEQAASEPLHIAYSLALNREFSLNAYASMIFDSLRSEAATVVVTDVSTTTRKTITDTVPQTFGACLKFVDGSRKRLRGMALAKLDLAIASRRLVQESSEWQATTCEEENDALGVAASEVRLEHSALSGLDAFASFGIGEAIAETPTFSANLFFERDIRPCQFSSDGIASRLDVRGPWEFLGRCVARLGDRLPVLASAPLIGPVSFTLAKGLRSFRVASTAARMAVGRQTVTAPGQVDTQFEFQSLASTGAVFTTTEIEPL